MPRPTDHNPIESQLADLKPRGASTPPPEAFLTGVVARRRRTRAVRAAVGAAGVMAALALGVLLMQPTPTRTPEQVIPLAGDQSPSPAPTGVEPQRATLASFHSLYADVDRQVSLADASLDHVFDDPQSTPASTSDQPPLRLGDRTASFVRDLSLHGL